MKSDISDPHAALPGSSKAQRVGQWLNRAALAMAVAALVSIFVLPELFETYLIEAGDMFAIGLNMGLFALPLALAGWITCKVARVPLPRFRLLALILGLLAAAPLVLFVIAYSNCPNGVC
jgi:hypothetical protein